MLVATEPCAVLESVEKYATVEVSGNFTRGQLVIDWKENMGTASNVRIITKIDSNRLTQQLQRMVS
jgi:inosine-uridine nucleoside N-ribohydrolase